MTFILIVVFLIVYAGLSIYVGLKGYFVFNNLLPFFNQYIYWTLFGIISISIILAQVGKNFMPELMSKIFQIVGSYWIAAFEYLLMIYALVDIVRLVVRHQHKIVNKPASLAFNVLILVFVGILLIYGMYHAKDTKIAKYNLNIDKKAGELKKLNVVMVSDIHLGEIIDKNRLEKMVAKVNELKPDVVLLAGDMIDNRIEPFEKNDMGQQFLNIKSKYGVYGVLGNHELFGGNINAVEMAYKNAGIKCLVDEVTKVENSFYIVGRNDSSSRVNGQSRKTLEELLKDADKNLPIIVMDHQPNNLKEGKLNGIDIQFSGHTHIDK